jgi:hypothetical protein
MQTFLPYADFYQSAQVLDKKRCWKQVVEAKQIISCLTGTGCLKWNNHPAIKMWVGHTNLLKVYFNSFLSVCLTKHTINTALYPYFTCKQTAIIDDNGVPFWLGNEDFHRSHRARLIEKDRDFYLPKFPEDEKYNEGKYWWPDMRTKTFKII